jgi:hypothetical protein
MSGTVGPRRGTTRRCTAGRAGGSANSGMQAIIIASARTGMISNGLTMANLVRLAPALSGATSPRRIRSEIFLS